LEGMTAGGPGGYAATGSSDQGWTMQIVALKAASSSVSSGGGASSPLNACDLATPYGTIDLNDVQAAINMSLGSATCTANIIGPGLCNVVAVQRVINAALPGGTCVTSSSLVAHSASLSW